MLWGAKTRFGPRETAICRLNASFETPHSAGTHQVGGELDWRQRAREGRDGEARRRRRRGWRGFPSREGCRNSVSAL